MRKLLLILFAAALMTSLPLVHAVEHEWTNTQGKTINAEFVSATNESVTISMQGKTFVVKLTDLSPESQALARKLSQPEKPVVIEPAGEDKFLPLAHFVPWYTAVLVTLHPGQILQKVDHAGLINKPAVAHAYSAFGSATNGTGFDPDDPDEQDEQKALGFLTRLIEQPAETTGIDMDQPIHVALIRLSLVKLEARLILRLKDSARFENFILKFLHASSFDEEETTWIPTEGRRRIIMLEDEAAIAHDGATAILIFHNSSESDKTIGQLADEQLKPSGKPAPELPPILLEQLAQSHDLGVYFNMEALMPFLALFMKAPAHIKEMKAFISLNSEPGRLGADLNLDFGEKNGLKLGTDPLPNEILDILPADSFAQASLSVDLASSNEKLKLVLSSLDLDLDEIREELSEELGIDIGELPELFSGQAAFGITGLDLEEEEVSFIAAIGTKVPAAEVYTRIIKEGLLRALGREGGDFDLLEYLSFSAKDQRLFISTKNHADILKAGKAEKIIGKEDRDALRDGLFNLSLDIPVLPEALLFELLDELDLEDFLEGNFISQLQNLRLRVTQKSPSRFGIHLGLQLMDKDAQALRTLAHLGADLANPYYSNTKAHSKILEAEKSASANPGQLAETIIGTWSGKLEDDHDLGGWSARLRLEDTSKAYAHYKITLLKNGAKKWEDNRGRSLQTRWTLNGTTYKEYYKDILVHVATILSSDDQTMTFIDYMDRSRNESTWEPHTHKRADPDYKLPELPERPELPEPEVDPPTTSGNSRPSEPMEAPTIPMQEAVARGDIESVRQHLDAGTDVNERNKVGWTPLHAASSRGRKEIVELLLDKGAQVNAQHDGGISPLGFAVARKHTETAELLRKHGGSIQSIYDAAIQGNLEFVRQRLDSGADVNGRNKAGGTLLHPAAVGGRTEIVKMLIDKGAQVNVKNNFGSTPLDLAVANQHTETAELLRKHGGLRSSEVAIDLDNPETRRKIVEQAIDYKQLRQSSEKLTVVPNPSGRGEIYSGWAKEMKGGRVGSLRRYKQGKKHGQEIFWLKNGQKRWAGTYKDGKLYGLSTLWHRNGQKGSETTYRDGERISSKTWDEDGNPK